MSWRAWLGFRTTDQTPYEAVVTYSSGAVGRFPLWAQDGRDALAQLLKLMPVHEPVAVVTLRVVRRPGNSSVKAEG